MMLLQLHRLIKAGQSVWRAFVAEAIDRESNMIVAAFHGKLQYFRMAGEYHGLRSAML